MTQLTIDVSDDDHRELDRLAAQESVAAETYLARRVVDLVRQSRQRARMRSEIESADRDAIRRHLEAVPTRPVPETDEMPASSET